MNTNDGGNAFPYTPGSVDFNGTESDNAQAPGMSLLDYFAAKAMGGLIGTRHPHHAGEDGASVLSSDAWDIAEAMVAERARRMGSAA